MTTPVLPVFGDKAISDVFDRLVSLAQATGKFDSVNQHEPKNAPNYDISCSIWAQTIKPFRGGLAATSLVVNFDMRIYKPFTSQPFDLIDPNVMAATVTIMAALSGNFQLGGVGDARAVDLLGMTGSTLSAIAGYVEIDRRVMRVMTINVPIIFNDSFLQES